MKNDEFKAREGYRDKKIVINYDNFRFTSIKGRVTNLMELGSIERALQCINTPIGGRVLDIPCGTGRLSLHLASKGYCVTGADISEEMVNISTEKSAIIPHDIRPRFIVTEAERLGFPDNSFETVVSLRLFGHVPPSIRAIMLKEFSRVSSSYLVIAYYHASSIQCSLRKKTRAVRGVPWYPVTYKAIQGEIAGAGLELIKIRPLLIGVSETLVVIAKKTAHQ
ncbi:class I SAM-dependent methyltransferase [Trichlorobacter lovleyi]|uniref:class I SAM-dependent methyltransferase n=1 Tax=Trichlorobacter lovleyi TaxID=313985 RepID=UPI0024810672|nr:class I SAM-dependent methyltransferase [Trichlorobacter lovleyi]